MAEPLAPETETALVDDVDVDDGPAMLSRQIPADRFEVLAEPLGWRCRSCRAEVFGDTATAELATAVAVARLAESAADHAMFCGRCDD